MNKTKEIQAIEDALGAWYDKYNGNVVMNCSIMAFDEDGEAIENDSYMWFSGVKQAQLQNCREMMNDVIKDQFDNQELAQWLKYNSENP